MVLIERENEVAGERPIGEGCRFPNHGSRVIGPPQPQGAEAACIRHGSGQARICRQRRLDDRELDPEQLAHRRSLAIGYVTSGRPKTVLNIHVGLHSVGVRSLCGSDELLVPAVERREVARIPSLAQAGGCQVPVGPDLARHGT